MTDSERVVLRPGQASDMPFIYKSILMGTYHGNRPAKGSKLDSKAPVDYFSSIDQDTFMKGYHAYLEALFTKPDISFRVVCLGSDHDVILGFSVFSGTSLHFCFVKPDWRGIGLGSALCPKDITTVTGFTRVGDIIRRKRGWAFNPWL